MGRNQVVLSTRRAQQGLQLLTSADDAVVEISPLHYRVRKQSGRGFYDVEGDGWRWVCSCPDFQKNSQLCDHCWAVELAIRIRKERLRTVRGPSPPEVQLDVPVCPRGRDHAVVRNGLRKCRKGSVQRYLCRSCGRKFTVDHGFSRIHSAPRVVVAAVDLWAKKVSFREIADHLRGVYQIPVTKSTIERWVRKMRRRLAFYADRCGPSVGAIWHADETMVNVDGRLCYAWNVMDHETRYWLASPLSEGRKVSDARRPLREAKAVAGFRPRALVTDGYPAYREAVRKELYSNRDFTTHLVIPPIRKVVNDSLLDLHPGNNIIERLQGIQRGLTKVFRGFDCLATAQDQIDGYRGYYNLVRPHSGLAGLTPAQRAGIPVPVMANEGRLMAVLAAAYEFQVQNNDISRRGLPPPG